MLNKDELRAMCLPPDAGKAYYRPFTCRGEMRSEGIFFIGINPATVISSEEIGINEYVDLLCDYQAFIAYYKRSRLQSGKSKISRTRMGMNAFLDEIGQYTKAPIFETDVIPYPTASLKFLEKEPSFVLERGKEIFLQLVKSLTPKLLIVHGKKAADSLIELFRSNELINERSDYANLAIEEMEARAPLFTIEYDHGKQGMVMACRHFMYYGSTGKSFRPFTEKVISLLEE